MSPPERSHIVEPIPIEVEEYEELGRDLMAANDLIRQIAGQREPVAQRDR